MWITVAMKERESDGHCAGVPIEVKEGDRLPDVILMNGYALTYRDINDDGYPVYVMARLYVCENHPQPEPEYLLPSGEGL